MDALLTTLAVVVAIVGPLVAFGVAALRFGADSRLSITDGSTRWI